LRSVAVAAAYARGQSTTEPRISGNYAKTNIRHRELIYSVVGTSTFTTGATFAINPGLPATFPWLSSQALGWEQYKFNKLRFCYYSRTGTTTPGSILLIPDYDAADSAPLTEQVASSYRDVVEEVPWVEEFTCPLDPKALHETGNRKFVRTGALAANLDVKTYDGGNLFVCTTDGTAVNWGKLWVEYDVDFFVPQLPPQGLFIASFLINNSGTGLTQSAVMGTGSVAYGPIGLSCPLAVLTMSNLLIGQEYQLTYLMAATVTTAASFSGITGGTYVTSVVYGNPNGPSTGSSLGTNVTVAGKTFIATSTTASITITSGTATTPAFAYCSIYPIPIGTGL
jgi:hypothetical protein